MKVEIFDEVKKRNVFVDEKLAAALVKSNRAKYKETTSEPEKKKRGRKPGSVYKTKDLTEYGTRELIAENKSEDE